MKIPDQPDDDLCERGYGPTWWASATPLLRETVWTLRARLRALHLWRFVKHEYDSEIGALDVLCTDVTALKAALVAQEFTRPRTRRGRWEAAERRAVAALHVKHFDGWVADRVQLHIDPIGLHLPWRWWLVPLVPPIQALRHWRDYDGYRDISRVRALLSACGLTDQASRRAPPPS